MQLDINRLIAYFGGVNALSDALKQMNPEQAVSTAAIINGEHAVHCR